MKWTGVAELVGCVALGAVLFGCSYGADSKGALKIESIRPIPPVLKTIKMTIQRDDLRKALEQGNDLNTIRLITVYSSAMPIPGNEYRLFGVRPESVFALLGLETADVLVAAHGYVVANPQQFINYVRLLLQEDKSSIEIRRDGVPILLDYTFVPMLRGSSGEQVTPVMPPAGLTEY